MSNSEQVSSFELKALNRIVERPKLNLQFEDISYFVRDASTSATKGSRQILKALNGEFRSGELTAILGPSGSGKTALLNTLAGYTSAGIEGSVKINGSPIDRPLFKKLSSYILQEDAIQPHLSVKEAMTFAARFKLGPHVKYENKMAVVEEVIRVLGLESCCHTESQDLSGGQRKRLRVALELCNNPSVLFLDEPTSGLDNVAITQCIQLLKKTSQFGCTVICTIHQPPASIFQFFDQIYIIADGSCVYNGSPRHLIGYMDKVGYSCPSSYTPVEYMIELVHSQPPLVEDFKKAINHGRLNFRDYFKDEAENLEVDKSTTDFPNTFFIQFCTLLSRIFLQLKRNKLGLFSQLFVHLLMGTTIGAIFFESGNDATQIFAIIKYGVCVNVFFFYTYLMVPIILFPLEVRLMKMELFNRWYGLKAFYCAVTVSTLPFTMIFSLLFCILMYYLAGNPTEPDRFLGFYLISLAVALTSQGVGLCVGSAFSITAGSVIALGILGPFIALATYSIDFRPAIRPFWKLTLASCFLRNGVVGMYDVLFYKREPLDCPDEKVYCHYSRPEVFMKDVELPLVHYSHQLGLICAFMVGFRVLAYLLLKLRLHGVWMGRIEFAVRGLIKCWN